MAKKKTGIIVGAVVGVVLLILIIGFFMMTGSKTRVALLNIEAGDVQVDTGSGWIGATSGMSLSLDDRVKTGSDGEASVILYESSIISLMPDTEVAISELSKENVNADQETGTTWNKFTGLSGLKSMEVETPTAVATVRGTDWAVTMEGILVASGEVEVTNKETGDTIMVPGGKKAIWQDGSWVLDDLTEEDLALILRGMKRHLEVLKTLRHDEMDKHPTTMGLIKSLYKLSDADIEQKIVDLDEGRLNEDELVEKSPVDSRSIEKFVALTKEIKKHQLMIAEFAVE